MSIITICWQIKKTLKDVTHALQKPKAESRHKKGNATMDVKVFFCDNFHHNADIWSSRNENIACNSNK